MVKLSNDSNLQNFLMSCPVSLPLSKERIITPREKREKSFPSFFPSHHQKKDLIVSKSLTSDNKQVVGSGFWDHHNDGVMCHEQQ